MEFDDDAPGALVRCVYCRQVFGAPVYHSCPDAPEIDPDVQKKIDADPLPGDETVVVFDNGNRYHEEHPEKEGVAVCPATNDSTGEKVERKEAQEEGLVLCKVCADEMNINYNPSIEE